MLITVLSAAEIIGCSTKTVYKFIEEGKLTRVPNIEGGVRLDKEQVEEFARAYKIVRGERKTK